MLHWYGHVEHSNGTVKSACDIQVDGKRGPGGGGGGAYKQLTESGSSTLMIDTSGDLSEICHACSKPATWKGAH